MKIFFGMITHTGLCITGVHASLLFFQAEELREGQGCVEGVFWECLPNS